MLKMSWKTVTSNKLISLSSNSVPEGSTIYVRLKGKAGNISQGIPVDLPSAMGTIAVTYK